MRIFAVTLLTGLLLAASPAAAQEAPADEGRRLRGRITDPDRRAPVRGATIVLNKIGESDSSDVTVQSDGDGRFTLDEVPAGRHVIMTDKPGYDFGRFDVVVPETGDIPPLGLEIRRFGVIAGRVVDSRGKPARGMRVSLLRADPGGGGWSPPPGMSSRLMTDDRGEYRLFDLRPGRYVVSAAPPTKPAPRGAILLEAEPAFWPGVPGLEGAVPIEIGWGDVREGVDFQLAEAPETLVDGQAILPGDAASGATPYSVEVERVGSGGRTTLARSLLPASGRFVVAGLPPGEYAAVVSGRASGFTTAGWGERLFRVAGEGRVETTVEVQAPIEVAGRVVLREAPEGAARGGMLRFWLTRASQSRFLGRPLAELRLQIGEGDEHPFTLQAYRGRTRITRFQGPANGYPAKITLGDQEIESDILELPEGDPGELVIEIAYDHGDVRGKLRGYAGDATPQVGLQRIGRPIVRPIAQGGLARLARPTGTRVQPDGGFHLMNVPPGSYVIVAGPREQTAFVGLTGAAPANLSQIGESVEVKAGETATVEVDLLPDDFAAGGP